VLSRLSEEQRNGLVLFEMFNFSIKEVAQILGKKEGAVRVLLHRARDRMAAMLDEMEEDLR
jgi:RNA polymerase sigma-70 factor (ECF subfamily)